MKHLGTYQNRRIYWFDFTNFHLDKLPSKDWLCLMISSKIQDLNKCKEFFRYSIDNGILEFKGSGEFGEVLHDAFDETMVQMEINENHEPISVMTTGQNGEILADTFWECFFATCLPETADFDNISIVCTDIDGVDRCLELKEILERIDSGWLPD